MLPRQLAIPQLRLLARASVSAVLPPLEALQQAVVGLEQILERAAAPQALAVAAGAVLEPLASLKLHPPLEPVQLPQALVGFLALVCLGLFSNPT